MSTTSSLGHSRSHTCAPALAAAVASSLVCGLSRRFRSCGLRCCGGAWRSLGARSRPLCGGRRLAGDYCCGRKGCSWVPAAATRFTEICLGAVRLWLLRFASAAWVAAAAAVTTAVEATRHSRGGHRWGCGGGCCLAGGRGRERVGVSIAPVLVSLLEVRCGCGPQRRRCGCLHPPCWRPLNGIHGCFPSRVLAGWVPMRLARFGLVGGWSRRCASRRGPASGSSPRSSLPLGCWALLWKAGAALVLTAGRCGPGAEGSFETREWRIRAALVFLSQSLGRLSRKLMGRVRRDIPHQALLARIVQLQRSIEPVVHGKASDHTLKLWVWALIACRVRPGPPQPTAYKGRHAGRVTELPPTQSHYPALPIWPLLCPPLIIHHPPSALFRPAHAFDASAAPPRVLCLPRTQIQTRSVAHPSPTIQGATTTPATIPGTTGREEQKQRQVQGKPARVVVPKTPSLELRTPTGFVESCGQTCLPMRVPGTSQRESWTAEWGSGLVTPTKAAEEESSANESVPRNRTGPPW